MNDDTNPTIDWPAPPFDPATCRGDRCEYRASFDPETEEPKGRACGRAATQVIFWRSRRFSPSCGMHGFRALDDSARAEVFCVHPIEPAITVT